MRAFVRDLLNVPNSMSLFRIVGAPMLAVLWLGLEWRVAGLALGTLIGITDLLDGWVARKLNQTTELGALLDQLGDMLFEVTCLIILMMDGELWSGWLILYLFREFTVTVIRSYVGSRGGSLPSSELGKAKSNYFQWAFFVIFLGLILEQPGVMPAGYALAGLTPMFFLILVGKLAIYAGLMMSVLTGYQYLRGFARFYASEQGEPRS